MIKDKAGRYVLFLIGLFIASSYIRSCSINSARILNLAHVPVITWVICLSFIVMIKETISGIVG